MANKNYFPNQRSVNVIRDKVNKSSCRAFASIYKDNMFDAMCNLKASTFKIWMFLASNKDRYVLEYSPSYLSKVIGISIQTAKSAFNELIEKRYLIQDEIHKYQYNFYEYPQKKANVSVAKKSFVDEDTGEIIIMTYDELTKLVSNDTEAKKLWEMANYEVKT